MENHILYAEIPLNISDSNSMNMDIVGDLNMPALSITTASVTLPMENTARSSVLDASAVRVGNSLISARVSESRILRDVTEEF